MLLAFEKTHKDFEIYNVATGDYITVSEIARLAMDVAGLSPESVRLDYSGGDRGWKGDVPVVRLNTERIRQLGWRCRLNSRQALCLSMRSLLSDAHLGRL